ncbi:hypothetical protein Cni_G06181 [Canna indica]|uniref:Uncharacterized protein n=1 Tax=Canna indica TaxID=4628 RepID=A0AAQ3JWK2_9LILI|nr:hypothetical protein Cni_G06181 [Canna indica]
MQRKRTPTSSFLVSDPFPFSFPLFIVSFRTPTQLFPRRTSLQIPKWSALLPPSHPLQVQASSDTCSVQQMAAQQPAPGRWLLRLASQARMELPTATPPPTQPAQAVGPITTTLAPTTPAPTQIPPAPAQTQTTQPPETEPRPATQATASGAGSNPSQKTTNAGNGSATEVPNPAPAPAPQPTISPRAADTTPAQETTASTRPRSPSPKPGDAAPASPRAPSPRPVEAAPTRPRSRSPRPVEAAPTRQRSPSPDSPRPVEAAPTRQRSPSPDSPRSVEAATWRPRSPSPRPATVTSTPMPETTMTTLQPVAATRSPTPPQSPKVIKTSLAPTPPQSPRVTAKQSSDSLMPHPEPEPKPLTETQQNGILEKANGINNGGKGSNDGRNSNPGDTKAPTPPPNKEEKNSAFGINGRAPNSAVAAAKKEENETRAVTIAGHNLGAIMDLGSPHGYQSRKQHTKGEHGVDSATEGKKAAAEEEKAMITLVNSNVQSVNNSLLFSASCSVGSPGVHINLSSNRRRRQAKKGGAISSAQKNHTTQQ